MADLSAEEWNELAHELFTLTHRMRPHRGGRREAIDMRGEPMVLVSLSHHPEGMTAGELADAALVSTARMAVLVNGLEERGLVTRTKDDRDRRRTVVRITAAGKATIEERFNRRMAHVVAILRELGPADARELVRITGRLAEIVPQMPCDAEGAAPVRERGDDR